MKTSNRARAFSRHVQIIGAFVVVAIPVAVACGGKVDEPNGSPTPSTTTTATASATTTATATASASTTPTSSATSPPLISCPGQPPPSPAPCAVSFNATIFPYMSGEWACSNSSCHGPSGSSGTPLNAPAIDGSDPKAAYLSLAQFSGINSEPYINACSSDPSRSAILCNLAGSCPPTMPQAGSGVTPAIPPSPESIENLQTWLACGAPFN